MKWRSPRLKNGTIEEMESEIVGHFKLFFKRLKKLDDSLILIPWNEFSIKKPVKNPEDIKSRETMEIYVDKVFMNPGQSVWTRFQTAFNKEESLIISDDWCQGNAMYLAKEPVQEKVLVPIAWLLGSTKYHNSNELREILNTILPDKNQIDIRFQAIKLRSGERITPENTTKASHIYAGNKNAKTTLRLLKNIYRLNNEEGYPLGKVMRVVTNTSDPRSAVSPRMRINAETLRSKQRMFENSIQTLPSHYIQSLDLFLPSIGTSLRQAIMGIKTSASTSKSLFISTDTDSWGRVIFTFHKSKDTEAASIIPVLPVYLAHHYGARAWSWFNQEAKEELADYFYDEESGEIKCQEDQYSQELIDEDRWESLDDNEKQIQVDFSLAQWVVDIDQQATGNQYDDNGTVKTSDQTTTAGTSKPDTAKTTVITEEGLSSITDESKDNIINILLNKSDSELEFIMKVMEHRTKQQGKTSNDESSDIINPREHSDTNQNQQE